MTHANIEPTRRRSADPEPGPLPDPEAFGRTEWQRKRALAWGIATGVVIANAMFWGIAYGTRWPLELPAVGALLGGLVLGALVRKILAPSRRHVSAPAEAEPTDAEYAVLNASFGDAPSMEVVMDEPETEASKRELEAELRHEASLQRRARIARGLPWMIGVPSFVGVFSLASSWLPVDTAVGFAMPPAVLLGVLVHHLLGRRASEAPR